MCTTDLVSLIPAVNQCPGSRIVPLVIGRCCHYRLSRIHNTLSQNKTVIMLANGFCGFIRCKLVTSLRMQNAGRHQQEAVACCRRNVCAQNVIPELIQKLQIVNCAGERRVSLKTNQPRNCTEPGGYCTSQRVAAVI